MRWSHISLFIVLSVIVVVNIILLYENGTTSKINIIPHDNETTTHIKNGTTEACEKPAHTLTPHTPTQIPTQIPTETPTPPPTPTTETKCQRNTPTSEFRVCHLSQNEARFYIEWLEFHLLVGVTKFTIYDNMGDDNISVLLADYVKDGIVEIIRWPVDKDNAKWTAERKFLDENVERSFNETFNRCVENKASVHKQSDCQLAAHYDFIARFGHSDDWLAFFDVDEFMFPKPEIQQECAAWNKPHLSIRDALGTKYNDCAGYVVKGVVFGTNGYETTPKFPELITAEYLLRGERKPPYGTAKKSFAKGVNIYGNSVHDNMYLNAGRSCEVESVITLHHYQYRSKKHAAIRASKNGNPHVAYNKEQDAELTSVFDDSILYYLPKLKAALFKKGYRSQYLHPDY